jgi:hypothetical protein
MAAKKLSSSAGSILNFHQRGPVSMKTAREQNKQVTTREKAIRELRSAGIVTPAGNLKGKFK